MDPLLRAFKLSDLYGTSWVTIWSYNYPITDDVVGKTPLKLEYYHTTCCTELRLLKTSQPLTYACSVASYMHLDTSSMVQDKAACPLFSQNSTQPVRTILRYGREVFCSSITIIFPICSPYRRHVTLTWAINPVLQCLPGYMVRREAVSSFYALLMVPPFLLRRYQPPWLRRDLASYMRGTGFLKIKFSRLERAVFVLKRFQGP